MRVKIYPTALTRRYTRAVRTREISETSETLECVDTVEVVVGVAMFREAALKMALGSETEASKATEALHLEPAKREWS